MPVKDTKENYARLILEMINQDPMGKNTDQKVEQRPKHCTLQFANSWG